MTQIMTHSIDLLWNFAVIAALVAFIRSRIKKTSFKEEYGETMKKSLAFAKEAGRKVLLVFVSLIHRFTEACKK